MENRRSYYRILHVQPDAPHEVIKATYRTLMQTLKQHPDLGGDHWNAALINQAYAVLSRPSKRKQYDDCLRQQAKQPSATNNTALSLDNLYCVFCKSICSDLKNIPLYEQFCLDCHSPLQTIDHSAATTGREIIRKKQGCQLDYYTFWPGELYRGKMNNVSPCGLCFQGEKRALIGQIIQLKTNDFIATGRVLDCQAQNHDFLIRVQFVTLYYEQYKGNFVSLSI